MIRYRPKEIRYSPCNSSKRGLPSCSGSSVIARSVTLWMIFSRTVRLPTARRPVSASSPHTMVTVASPIETKLLQHVFVRCDPACFDVGKPSTDRCHCLRIGHKVKRLQQPLEIPRVDQHHGWLPA